MSGKNDAVTTMKQHISSLLRNHNIKHISNSGHAWADRPGRVVGFPVVRGYRTYLDALHEIAHVVAQGCAYHHPVLHQESSAWQWAVKNSVVPLPASVWKSIHAKISTYL